MSITLEFYKEKIENFESMSFEERRKAVTDLKLDDKQHNKATLKGIFRVKPAKLAVSEYSFKNRFGKHVDCYTLKQCVPMRKIGEPSPAQLKARQRLPLLAKLKSDQGKVSAKAGSWLEQEPLFLDTETTGLDDQAQIIEIAILNAAGQVLLCQRIKPTVEIGERAQEVHGISAADLEDCPSWSEVAGEVQRILVGRMVVIFNADYDTRLLKQTAAAHGDSLDWLENCKFYCAMRLAAKFYGATNKYGTISLANACIEAGVAWKGAAHSAEADTLATLDLVKTIAEFHEKIVIQLEALEKQFNAKEEKGQS